jgi:hypothetical protein
VSVGEKVIILYGRWLGHVGRIVAVRGDRLIVDAGSRARCLVLEPSKVGKVAS